MLIHVIRPIPEKAIDFIAQHEGCRLAAYPDPATGGAPWTIGYGSTRGVVQGMTITLEDAQSRLRGDLETSAKLLEDCIGEDIVESLTENQYAALLSFVFNVGCKRDWKICVALRAKNYDAVPAELMRFTYANGRKMQGLVNRRAEEVKLWSTDEPGSTPEAPPSSITRAIPTPPAPQAVKPLAKSKSFLTTVATAAIAIAQPAVESSKGAIKAVNDAVAPYAGQSEVLRGLQDHLNLVLAGLAVASVFFLWLKDRNARTS